jgi:hypothetical protein
MRFLLKVSFPVEAGNATVRDGSIGEKIQSILEDLKPEAAYFTDSDGKRTGYIIFDMQETSQIPGVAEPWMLAFNASIEFHAVMVPEDLAKAGPDFERVVKKYG